MLDRLHTVLGIALLCAIALAWIFPGSLLAKLALLTTLIGATPFTVLRFGRMLYSAVKLDYVVPNEMEGPAYRSEQPVTFWSNVIFSLLIIPGLIAGALLVAKEVVKLGGYL